MLSKLRNLLVLLIVATNAQAQLSVPPAHLPYEQAAKDSHPAAAMRLPASAAARAVILTPPSIVERAQMTAMRASDRGRTLKNAKSRGLGIGFGRAVAAADSAIRLADLEWHPVTGGARAARISLTSPGAVAIRIELALKDAPAGLNVRFEGSRRGAPVFGPYAAGMLERDGEFWSPVLEGETGTIELELPATSEVGNAMLEMPLISHLGVPGDKLKALDGYIGESGACQTDIACLAPALKEQLATATNAVARIFVTVKGVTIVCTGTLLNDARGSFTPYFLTTNHCIDDVDNPAGSKGVPAAAANSVNSYWFFQAATCGSQAQPNYVLLAGGAKLLARSADYDWSLLRLNAAPPAGSTFAAWNASGPLDAGANAAAIHHPNGDLKKVAQGNVFGYQSLSGRQQLHHCAVDVGRHRAGKQRGRIVRNESGGRCFRASRRARRRRFVVQLSAGHRPVFSFRRHIPADPAIRCTRGVESGQDRAGRGILQCRQERLSDHGRSARDQRSRRRHGLGAHGPALSRLYGSVGGAGRRRSRCAGSMPLRDRAIPIFFPRPRRSARIPLRAYGSTWVRESAAAFYVVLPDAGSGACPANHFAVYRFASNANPPRRRYTSEVVLRDALIDGRRMDAGRLRPGARPGLDVRALAAATWRSFRHRRRRTSKACGGRRRRVPNPDGA